MAPFTVYSASYTIGIVPQHAPKVIAQAWQPLLSLIEEETGHRIRFKTAKDIPTFEQALAAGEYDFAYMNPYHFVVFNESPGYRAMVRQRDKAIKGIIVVHQSSSIRTLDDLNGKTIAFPAPAAFAATIIPRATLSTRDITHTPTYVHSHDSVYLNVQRGFFEAGGGIIRSLEASPKEVRQHLRVLWQSPPFTSHAIASHPRVPDEHRKQITALMLSLSKSQSRNPVLSNLHMSGFERAKDGDWDDVRALHIDLLSVPEK
ncbi:phosphate/phosphite/phosphonate ABC transporter substrate-binding protein [Aestuariibacter sp. A3R04]|uniref:phosphate/phosphite/phosphonate ABC transporter substrate-binding protein n=1 Tax=Aestuariibacter sp. A3R04 TaxID=2841571 RepID=UPI002090EB43|nr:phosphate/phosphite/phosphonate ABC transporter substrate-binding protein [Aestuariibacter sp. A3R04]